MRDGGAQPLRYGFEMSEHDLDRALTLESCGEGLWSASADPNYEAGNGMFGGWTVAVTLQAVSESAAGASTPCAITVNFINKIEAGPTCSSAPGELGEVAP